MERGFERKEVLVRIWKEKEKTKRAKEERNMEESSVMPLRHWGSSSVEEQVKSTHR